jgi:lipid-A-disaccharide synthase
MKIGILAGEPSGDILGAGVLKKLREWHPNLSISGIGGPLMIKEGCQSLFDMERLSVMGFIEPLKRLPELLKIRSALIKHFLENPPDIFIGIDSPDFNLGLELKLRKANIPVVHYVSPSVWAWRQKRIHKIAKATDLVLTLFPFEMDFYQKHAVPAKFVGHPLADAIPLVPDKIAARKKLHLALDSTYIAILPGSRGNELKYMAELFIEAAKKCFQQRPSLKFITSAINDNRAKEFKELCQKIAPDLPIEFFIRESHTVMAAADLVLVTSGTATFETMLYKRPMVIAYRVGPLTFQIAKRLIKVPFIGLPNLLANEKWVPEFIQHEATTESIANALLDFLNHPDKMQRLEEKFTEMHRSLRRDANLEAALAIQQIALRKNNNVKDGESLMDCGNR